MNENNLTLSLNLNNLKENERAQLLALVEKANKPKSKVWFPDIGDSCYQVGSNGNVYCFAWEGDSNDHDVYMSGNCYRTEKEAEFAAEARKVYAALQRYAEEHNERATTFDGINVNYVIKYHKNELVVMSMRHVQNISDIYFTSIKIAKAAIAAIGEDLIKKYLFGVDKHDC